MKKTALIIAMSLGLVACQTPYPSTSVAVEQQQAQEQSFAQFSQTFIDKLWQQAPTWALYSGYHQYDGKLEVPNAKGRNNDLLFIESQLAQLQQFSPAALTGNERTDYLLIENLLKQWHWELTVFNAWQWDPSSYNVAGGFAQIINEDFAPIEQRLQSVLERLQSVPAYYAAARENIQQPTLEHTELAILQNQGGFSVFSDELLAKVEGSELTATEKALFRARLQTAKEALQQHIDWLTDLKAQLVAEGAKDFRIGEALYEQKFAFDIQSGMTAKQLYDKAVAEKNIVQQQMLKITRDLWPKYFTTPMPSDDKLAVRTLIDHLSVRHVKAEDFVSEVSRQIPELVDFVNQKQLITLDPSKPLLVRKTPEYMRGFAGASISAPGPYDTQGNTYYNVTPLTGMDADSAESYLREYNHWILQILNIHEAIPGHYAQLVYSNQSPSLVKSLFGNGAMVEGWAVYTERMMLEEGYGDFEPELWLMYYKWNLRVICNTILDYSIQVLNMEQEQGLDLLMNEAFQQRAEAESKWRRATLSQVQLTSYYAGYREIYDFREEMKAKQGEDFKLNAWHETFLSYGSAPVKYIRQLMMAEK
ncbi:DUF885 domain-containing protein [Shewanella sp. NIFS-20-20]|uniref:DUF885 domain-containing protein n=1 Tax=Shewanella sp. NIFS-20-20 TaxID=2853806 RepID=UPI001C47FC5E|nr:DUF885 domain-containing protein [Shewanella sp. NIFS-20-20]MBV7315217.1 DUF885 domain-containing protein [Shewanella sp. NIFS-20-20]